MKKNISRNGVSLELRSKEVSEVMGNIPSWITSWGAVIICLLFGVCMLMITNIRCEQKFPATAFIADGDSKYRYQVSVSDNDAEKFKPGQQVSISFEGGKARGVIIDKKKNILTLSVLENIITTKADYQVISDVSAFRKIFGAFF